MSSGAAVVGRAPGGAAAARFASGDAADINVPFDERAIQVAVEAAGEAGSELLCDAIPLGYSSYSTRWLVASPSTTTGVSWTGRA